VLGHHVTQAGSLVAPERLRFDFTHPTPLSQTEVEEIEHLVNEQVLTATTVDTVEQPTDEAIANGAIALFGEKYGDRVRVVSISEFSRELCGGTHCYATGEIGSFLIEQESGTAAGVRRLEAITGVPAIQRHQARRSLLNGILQELASPEARALDVLKKQQAQTKQLARDVNILKMKLELASEMDTRIDIDGVTLLTRRADGLDKSSLRTLADQLKGNIKSGLVVLTSATETGRVVIIVSVTSDLKARVPAGQVVKALAPFVGGGGGGGRSDFAEAGGKEPQHIDHMLSESENVVRGLLDNKE
jgi:alanyl-tRNA synthetase